MKKRDKMNKLEEEHEDLFKAVSNLTKKVKKFDEDIKKNVRRKK